jgi:hypothetical protein
MLFGGIAMPLVAFYGHAHSYRKMPMLKANVKLVIDTISESFGNTSSFLNFIAKE